MIVVKFGGKTLNDTMKREKAALKLQEICSKEKVVVVVSAMGRYPDPYSTDGLAGLVSNHLSKKERDRLVACGEIITSCVLSDYLNSKGVKSISFSVYDLLLSYSDNKLSLSIDRLMNGFAHHDICIIPGFIALDGFDLITLPRGGSNITASYLSGILKCPLIIYSDDYIYSSRKEEGGKFLDKVSYDDLEKIVSEAPNLFPLVAIAYLKNARVPAFVRTLDCDIRETAIGDFK